MVVDLNATVESTGRMNSKPQQSFHYMKIKATFNQILKPTVET